MSVDNTLYMLEVANRTMTKLVEIEDEFDPIISIHKVKLNKR